MRTPVLLSVPPATGVGAAIATAVAEETPPDTMCLAHRRRRPCEPPSSPPCASICGDVAGEDAAVSTHAIVTGGDGSGRPTSSGRTLPV